LTLPLSLLLSGCLLHPVDRDPIPEIAIPARFSTADVATSIQGQNIDWESARSTVTFDPRRDSYEGDSALRALIIDALAGNLTVARAASRLRQARSSIGTEAAGLLPTVSVTGRTTKTIPDGAPNTRIESATGSGALSIDLFGETVSAINAARFDARAAEYSLADAKLQLTHDVAGAYFNAAEARELLALLDLQINIATELLDITEFRFGQGAGSLSDLLQQEEQIASLEAQRPPLLSDLRIAENRLDALMGRAPDGQDITRIAQTNFPDGNLALGAPSDLLNRRPDLQSARASLVAADYRVAEAVADFFPDISITGMLSIPNLAFASTMIWTAVGQATQTLLNGGRRVATVIRQGAVVEEQAAAYAQTWIDAIGEIENISWQEGNQRELIARLEHQVALGTDALGASRNRYTQGTLNYLSVLAALQSVQATERSLIQAKRRLVGFRLNLLRALGLTPTGELVLGEEESNE
jgi:NodT family efflux transporter outer membrane factor (OMF) lipoprotein